MVPVISVSQMRAMDQEAIQGNQAVGYSYMRKAAQGLFDAVVPFIKDPACEHIAIVCGKGNNGGDGLVLGSILLDNRYKPMCFGLCDPAELVREAKIAYEEYVAKNGNFFRVDDTEDLKEFTGYSVIVDAILGTGIRGNPRGIAAEAIAIINKCGKSVVSVDTPSGLDNDTGIPGEPTVRASVTVTMGYPKPGHFFYPGRGLAGRLVVRDLGYPDAIARNHRGKTYVPGMADLQKLIPPRRPAGSKFDHGLAFLLCGSRGMTGSATLAARAALRTGCGMVHLAAPASVVPALELKLTETVVHPVEETDEGSVSADALPHILEKSGAMQAVLIGPGISHHPETSRLVRDCVARMKGPVVCDADGINAFRGCARLLKERTCDMVLTPHEGEWQRLFGPLPGAPLERIEALRGAASTYALTIVYKGSPTIIATPGGETYIIALGNSGMASAGSGDVLGGIIVSLCAQGCTTADAAVCGAALHALAGDSAARMCSEYCVTASDLIDSLCDVFTRLTEGPGPVFFPDA